MHYKQLRRRVNVNNNFVPHNKILTMISAAMDAIKKFGIINKRQKAQQIPVHVHVHVMTCVILL